MKKFLQALKNENSLVLYIPRGWFDLGNLF